MCYWEICFSSLLKQKICLRNVFVSIEYFCITLLLFLTLFSKSFAERHDVRRVYIFIINWQYIFWYFVTTPKMVLVFVYLTNLCHGCKHNLRIISFNSDQLLSNKEEHSVYNYLIQFKNKRWNIAVQIHIYINDREMN